MIGPPYRVRAAAPSTIRSGPTSAGFVLISLIPVFVPSGEICIVAYHCYHQKHNHNCKSCHRFRFRFFHTCHPFPFYSKSTANHNLLSYFLRNKSFPLCGCHAKDAFVRFRASIQEDSSSKLSSILRPSFAVTACGNIFRT